jgi:hypothetical protein
MSAEPNGDWVNVSRVPSRPWGSNVTAISVSSDFLGVSAKQGACAWYWRQGWREGAARAQAAPRARDGRRAHGERRRERGHAGLAAGGQAGQDCAPRRVGEGAEGKAKRVGGHVDNQMVA